MTLQPLTRTLEAAVTIAAPREAVWRALTEAEGLKRWLALDARVLPRTGGSIRLAWGDDRQGEWRIAGWVPGERLRVVETLGRDGGKAKDGRAADLLSGALVPAELTTDFFMEEGEGGIRLRLVQTGFGVSADWSREFEAGRRGWGVLLPALKHGVERHCDKPRTVGLVVVPHPGRPGWAWKRMMGQQGLNLHVRSDPQSPECRLYAMRLGSRAALSGEMLVMKPSCDFLGSVRELGDGLLHLAVWEAEEGSRVCATVSVYGKMVQAMDEAATGLREALMDALGGPGDGSVPG